MHLPPRLRTKATTATAATALNLPKRTFLWKGPTRDTHRINYVAAGCGEPLILVHGFGANSGHYRRSIEVLSKKYKVYAIDLLGFGASDKAQVDYTMELWRDLITDFHAEFVQVPAVLIGNSIGSLAALMVAAKSPQSVKGLVLINCCGAMNSKGVINDWRIYLLYPLLLLIDFLFKSPLAAYLFNKYRTPENIRGILKQVYRNQDAVDDELVEMLYRPSCDQGALGVFVSVLTGPPGPRPWDVTQQVRAPMLVLWGDKDTFVPLDSPVGKFFSGLPDTRGDTAFQLLDDVGHCPMDDRPDQVHAALLPWLASVYAGGGVCEADALAAQLSQS
ncbi:hypothetical protein FOA52_012719 [Chlamydomonas sp. UWO 241]|nr:hypothetical protein FOA52_012719 [Chlamydomonas sp. UWO 241]